MTYATKCAVVNQEVSKLIVDENLTSYQDVQKLDDLNYVRTGKGGSLEVDFGFHVYCVSLSQLKGQLTKTALLVFICCFRYILYTFPQVFQCFGVLTKKYCQIAGTKTITTRIFPGKYLLTFGSSRKKTVDFVTDKS